MRWGVMWYSRGCVWAGLASATKLMFSYVWRFWEEQGIRHHTRPCQWNVNRAKGFSFLFQLLWGEGEKSASATVEGGEALRATSILAHKT